MVGAFTRGCVEYTASSTSLDCVRERPTKLIKSVVYKWIVLCMNRLLLTDTLPSPSCSGLRSDCHPHNNTAQAYCPQAATSSVDLIDAKCTLGAWILQGTALVVSFEATTLVASLATYDDNLSTRTVALSAVAFTSWAFAASVLLAAFKWIFVGDLHRPSTTGRYA